MSRNAPRISLVVAAAENGVIGKRDRLPWRLPSELKLFRKRTLGHPVIMGRRTYQSIGHPLDGRDNIVVTRGAIIDDADVFTANSIEEALALGERLAAKRGVNEIFVIGGEQIFDAVRERADRIHFTRVHMKAEGERFFADPQPARWREVAREFHEAGPKDSADYTIITFERRR